jgi:cytidine deaminase
VADGESSHMPNTTASGQTTDSTAADDPLVDAARDARARAYVPYSHFAMGAAVETASGAIVAGAVVENVSLGLAMCAERVALFSTVAAADDDPPRRLALVSGRTDGRITSPCGACLQVALELGGEDLEVIAVDPDGQRESARVGDLLPRGPSKSTSR